MLTSVALRKESVDRNTMRRDFKALSLLSLSARRAWIEMSRASSPSPASSVALRKESVDRNSFFNTQISKVKKSLSARRAWIEIKYVVKDSDFAGSLSARRAWIEMPMRC